jgi:hypothetical protein
MTTPDTESGVKQLRPLFAWTLLAFVAISLFFALLAWLVPSDGTTIFSRSWDANGSVTGLILIALPLLAVLITSVVRPVVGGAKLMAFVALVEYAFIVLFGLLTFLLGLAYVVDVIHDARSSFSAFSGILLALLRLVLAALAAVATWRTFTALGGKIPLPQTAPSTQSDAPTQVQPTAPYAPPPPGA